MGSNYSHLEPEDGHNVENLPEIKKIYNVNDYKPSNIPWLEEIIPVHTCNNTKEKGIFSSLATQSYNEKLWDIFQNSLPPYHALKYHNVNLASYINEFNDKNFISQASILLFWNQNFGIRILNTIHESILTEKKKAERKNECEFDDMEDWFCQANGTLAMIQKTQYSNFKVPPNENDLCKNSKEFLLNSNILIQLPLKLTLFHQWLVVALYEILAFELDTLRLRHISIDENMVPLVTSTLSLIRKLKERIMLGFAILNSITVDYTMSRTWNPNLILDHVILPSIPALEYLFNETPGKILHNNIKPGTGKSYIPSDSYKLDEALSILHSKFAYNFQAWYTDKEIKSLFPQTKEKITNIISRLKSNKSKISTEKNSTFKSFSEDEKVLFELVKKNMKCSKKEKIQTTIDVIKNEIIDKNIIPGLKLLDVEMKFQNEESKAGEISYENKNDNIHNIIRCALMYNNAYKMLINHEKSQSIASKIISLQIYILEQEQISRLINLCSIIFNIKSETLDQKLNIDIKNMKTEIDKVHVKMNKMNRSSYWKLFPDSWKIPIQEPDYTMMESPNNNRELNSIVTKFNTRIGSMIYNFSKYCIEKNIQNEDIVNDLNIVHYILPCIVYSFAYEFKKEKKVSLYLNWIKDVIEHCEGSSSIEDESKEGDTGTEGFSFEVILEYIALNDCMNFCFNRNMGFVSALAQNVGFSGKMIHINSCILEWIYDFKEMPQNVDDFKTFNELVVFLMKYQFRAHSFINDDMYECSQNAFDVPVYDMCFENKNVQLGEMYFATIILLELSLMYSATMKHPDKSSIEHPVIPEQIFLKANNALKNTHMSIFSHAMYIDSAFQKDIQSDFDYKSYYIKHTKVLYDFYQTIKMFYQKNGPPDYHKLPHIFLHPFSLHYDRYIEKGVRAFLEGRFKKFEKRIKIFKHLSGTSLLKVDLKPCKNCSDINFSHSLIPCDECLELKIKEAHYYCSKKCKDAKWVSGHQEFHGNINVAKALFVALNLNQ